MNFKNSYHKLFVLLFLFHLVPLRAHQETHKYESPLLNREILFGRESGFEYLTSRELSIWGAARNLTLVPDCSYRDLQNFEAALIPHYGLEFTLDSPATRRTFLYLDLVSFVPARDFDSSNPQKYCEISSSPMTTYPSHQYDLPRVQWLEISINNQSVKTIYLGGRVFINSPVVIAVDRDMIRNNRIQVRLRPSDQNGYFAIWDAFLSDVPSG